MLGGITGCRTVVDAQQELAELTDLSPLQVQSTAPAAEVRPKSSASPKTIEAAEAALSSSVIQNDPKAIRPQRVDSRGWYLDSSVPLYLAFHLREPRWHHRALESLLDQPISSQEVLEAGTESLDPEIKATAWIGLVRSGAEVQDADLAELIQNPQVTATTKGALLEAITDTTIISQLFAERDNLIADTELKDDFSGQQLQEQFWYSLATTVPSVRSDERFTADFIEQPAEIQQTLLDLMLTDSTSEVPASVTQRFENLSPEVLRRVNLWHSYLRTVAPIDVLSDASRSPNFSTRENATIGLGREGSHAAEALLLDVSDSAPTLLQTAAIVAWGLMPQHEEWPRLAETTSWRVRLAIAQWIPLTSRNLETIQKLKEDNSHLVRQAMLARSTTPAEPVVERKPPAKPKPLLKKEMDLSPEEVVGLLDQIDQAEHATDAAARTTAREQLLLAPDKVLAAVDQVARTLVQYENDYLFEVLLPQCDPAFLRLQEATQGSSQMTLIALRDLELRSEQAPLPELILWRLGQHTHRFNSLDWQTIMGIVKQDKRPATESLVRQAIGHDDPLVRMRACEHVTQFPLPDVVHPLEDSLEHESPDVRCAAIRALSKLDGPNHREMFVTMLLDREVDVQLAAAQALDEANDPRGVQHIYRMTYSSSRETRLKGARAIAARQNQVDLPELIRLLDDETSIRKAALEGLSSLVPAENNPPPKNTVISLEAQSIAWKNWFDRQSLKR
ncbi:HEAT repeat domain-containing protein [Bremerella cremea]|nr:HEAT repeat domain-containing protein [Bremerella cremea]